MLFVVRRSTGLDKTMYVKWVVRRHKSAQASYIAFYDAYLMESYRNKAGVPRQRTLMYLGNVRQFNDTFSPIEREMFLLRCHEVLQAMTDLTPADQHSIVQQLYLKVPPLTWAEVQHGFHHNLHWYAQKCREMQRPLPTAEDIERLLRILEPPTPKA